METKGKIIFLFFLFILLVGGCVGIYFYFNQQSTSSNPTPQTDTSKTLISPSVSNTPSSVNTTSTTQPAPIIFTTTPPPNQITIGTRNIKDGDTISFKAGRTGKYCSNDSDSNSIHCNRDIPGAWENFKVSIIDTSTNTIRLTSGRNGKFCYDADDVMGIKCSDAGTNTEWNKFKLVQSDGNNFGIQSGRTGKYCRDDDDQFGIRCTTPAIYGHWEKFN